MPFISRIAAIFLMISAPAMAEQTPLGVGDTIPKDFTATDSLGRSNSFDSLKSEKGLILLFTRSADWCQYCKAQMKDWNTKSDAVKATGYAMAAISYDSPSTLASFEKANDLHYILLSDKDSAMIRAFGIRNEKFEEGSRFYGIPNPAIYVFDAAGNITHVFREESYKERPDVASVLSAITAAPSEAATTE